MARAQCWNCGEDVREVPGWAAREPQSCGRAECEKVARNMYEAERDERQYRAEQDDYERYAEW